MPEPPAFLVPPSPVVAAPPSPARVPITWMMKSGSSSVQYRAINELVKSPPSDATWPVVPYASHIGLQLLMMQDRDGTWPGGMLTVPDGQSLIGVGTIPAYRRLLELGWDPEGPALSATKRLLFRLLAQDDDPSFLAELTPATWDEDLIQRGRLLLREAAAAALAQAGYENDPRLRGAAHRLTDRVWTYLKSPLAQKPWVRVGNQHQLPPEAAPPSYHLLTMLSFMPQFRSERYELMDRLFDHLSQQWPRQQPLQQVGPHLLEQPHYVMGDFLPSRHVMDGDMPSALAWLEMMTRLGFLKKHDGWSKLLDRLLDDRDRKGIWTPPRSVVMPVSVPGWSWPAMPLTDSASGEDPHKAISVDVSFRLALIAALSGRGIELV